MKFSLRSLLLLITAAAIAVWYCAPADDPISVLTAHHAIVARDYSTLDQLLDSPIGIFPELPAELDEVDSVIFSSSDPPGPVGFRLLASFPNLSEVYFPCDINADDLSILKHCKNLKVVSFQGSNSGDEVVDAILEIPGTFVVKTRNSNITSLGIQRLKDASRFHEDPIKNGWRGAFLDVPIGLFDSSVPEPAPGPQSKIPEGR